MRFTKDRLVKNRHALAHAVRALPLVGDVPQQLGKCVEKEQHQISDGQIQFEQEKTGLK